LLPVPYLPAEHPAASHCICSWGLLPLPLLDR
jgi:hypothetical protein